MVSQFQRTRRSTCTLAGEASGIPLPYSASSRKEARKCGLRPCTQCGRDSHEDALKEARPVSAHGLIAVLTERSPQDLRKFHLEDGPIRLLLQAVEKREKPDAGDVRCEGSEAQRLLQLRERLFVDSGLLKRKYEDTGGIQAWQQLVVLHMLREEIMNELHAGALEGHLGVDKMVFKIRERFYWPGMYHAVNQWICTSPAVPQENQDLSGIMDHSKPSKSATLYK